MNLFLKKSLIIVFHLVSWLGPVPFCAAVAIANVEGPSLDAPWCFIPSDQPEWRLAYYVPMYISIIFVFAVYIATLVQIRLLKTTNIFHVQVN